MSRVVMFTTNALDTQNGTLRQVHLNVYNFKFISSIFMSCNFQVMQTHVLYFYILQCHVRPAVRLVIFTSCIHFHVI